MSPAARSSLVTSPASDSEALYNMLSVTRLASHSDAPKPRPGKMYMLLHWLGVIWAPLTAIVPNGDPLAKMHCLSRDKGAKAPVGHNTCVRSGKFEKCGARGGQLPRDRLGLGHRDKYKFQVQATVTLRP